jgi:hypothetical protein
LHQWWQKNITTPAAPVESPNSKTASPLLERCAQFRLELTALGLEQASPNEGKVQKHENLQLFPVFLE